MRGTFGRALNNVYESSSSSSKAAAAYCYVLCEVRKVHFDEHAPYFTVQRMDDWSCIKVRATTQDTILPIRGKGAVAALKAAKQSSTGAANVRRRRPARSVGVGVGGGEDHEASSSSIMLGGLRHRSNCNHAAGVVVSELLEDGMITEQNGEETHCKIAYSSFVQCCGKCRQFIKQQATLVLRGDPPYHCTLRLSWVNVLALCSFWFMLTDQARLAFMTGSSEYVATVISTIVWLVLVLELAFEVWIWPRGFFRILRSEMAFDPNTARYLSLLHLIVESLALILFMPEFVCLFKVSATPRRFCDVDDCVAQLKVSINKASLIAVLGPTRMDVFWGHLFFFTVRLRIFGPIRRWTKMWIKSEFISRKRGMPVPGEILRWPSGSSAPRGISGNNEGSWYEDGSVGADGAPYGHSGGASACKHNHHDHASELDSNLKEASHIGTALMVINSYRVAVLLVFIVGMLPLIYSVYPNGGANNRNTNMVKLLNSNNAIAPSNSSKHCAYLEHTMRSFLDASAFGVKDFFFENKTNSLSASYMLWLQILPVRCPFQGPDGVITASICRLDFNKSSLAHYDAIDQNLCPVWSQGNENSTRHDLGKQIGVHPANIVEYRASRTMFVNSAVVDYSVTAMINESHTVKMMNFTSFILQIILLIFILATLSVLNGDQVKLVLRPLRRMLRIAVSCK